MERWEQVGETAYSVSDQGNVRKGDRLLQPFIAKSTGYLQIGIDRKRHNVHRLVAMTFCEGFQPDLVVNHKNGIKTDNRAANLEWVTRGENGRHAYRELGTTPSCRGRFSGSHPTSKAVIATDMKTGAETHYASGMDAVRDGFRSDSIIRACNGKINHHAGRYWRYA